MKKFTFILVLLTTINLIWAQSYEFDKSFGDNGVVKLPCNSDFCLGYKIQVLNDGSFLLYSVQEGENESGFEIRKFDNNGKIDENFGENGVFTEINSYTDYPLYHCLLPDNKIAVIDMDDNIENIRVRILKVNGEIEKTFSLNMLPGTFTYVIKCLYKDGFLYLSGIKNEPEELFIIKTDLNGKPDSTYAENGVFILKDDTYAIEFMDMEFQNNDLIVYSIFYDLIEHSTNDKIFRIKHNGNFDNDFGKLGYFNIEHTDGFGDLSVDSKDRIIFTPFYYDVIYRLDENGLPDINFDTDGKVDFNEIQLAGEYFFHSINSADEIFLFGTINNDEYEFGIPAIVKFKENGKIDNSFSSNGILLNSFNKLAINYNGEIDSNGNIITTGAYMINPVIERINMFLTRLKPKTSAEYDLGISEKLHVFPNPAADKFTIQLPEKSDNTVSIRMIDLLGNNVWKTSFSRFSNEFKELIFNFGNDLKNGQYFIITNIGNEVFTNKIIIQR